MLPSQIIRNRIRYALVVIDADARPLLSTQEIISKPVRLCVGSMGSVKFVVVDFGVVVGLPVLPHVDDNIVLRVSQFIEIAVVYFKAGAATVISIKPGSSILTSVNVRNPYIRLSRHRESPATAGLLQLEMPQPITRITAYYDIAR